MRRSKTHTYRSGQSRLMLAGVTLIVMLGVVLVVMAFQRPSQAPTPASHFVDVASGNQSGPAHRTLVIARAGEVLPPKSETAGVLMASLVTGQLPDGAMQAIVRTDSNCQPDQEGISHCLNELAIGSTTIVVRHHHKMRDVPCLTPGETINILSLEQYKKL